MTNDSAGVKILDAEISDDLVEAPPLRVCALGRVDYRSTWALQRSLAEARKRKDIDDTLLLLEHHPVITYGRNVGPDNLLWSEAELNARGVELVEVDRGGDATFHGPGQLVAYPILDLSVDCRDVRRYIHNLEQIMIETMNDYGVTGARVDGAPGAWVHAKNPSELDRKMGAVGVRLSRWVTHHGIGFNVNTELDYFKLIVPCGLLDKGVTSLAREVSLIQDPVFEGLLSPPPPAPEASELILDFHEVERHLTRHFARIFRRRIVMIEPNELILDPTD